MKGNIMLQIKLGEMTSYRCDVCGVNYHFDFISKKVEAYFGLNSLKNSHSTYIDLCALLAYELMRHISVLGEGHSSMDPTKHGIVEYSPNGRMSN